MIARFQTWLKSPIILLGAVLLANIVYAGMEEEAEKWLKEIDPKLNKACNLMDLANYAAENNINAETAAAQAEEDKRFVQFLGSIQAEILLKFPNWKDFQNKTVRRAFKYLSIKGSANMPIDRVVKMKELESQMVDAYSTATVLEYKTGSNKISFTEIQEILKNSEDPNEKEYYVTAWHDQIGTLVTPEMYHEYSQLLNEYARANGLELFTERWLLPYDDETEGWDYVEFLYELVSLADQIFPMYEILHAYVRMKLRQLPEYNGLIKECGTIPLHLTGNIWGLDWSALDPKTNPFPDAPSLDVEHSMHRQNYTPLKMFQEADKFFKGMGLIGVYPEFYNLSVLEKPLDGREIVCHPTAWDLCGGPGSRDFRVQQCTLVNEYYFRTTHHELGHIEYFQQYTNLPYVFRGGANPGFHEAIGDALALAVMTPEHLQCRLNLDLGLGQDFCNSEQGSGNITETEINYLYRVALEKIALFPFTYTVDLFRMKVLENKIKKEDYNAMWWSLRKALQGLHPPTNRAENGTLFDPAALFHINTDIDFFRYFVSIIVQFQFYEAMCIAAGEYDPNNSNSKPLHRCDFAESKEAGKKLSDMMKLGFSKSWPDAMEVLTGGRKISVKSMLVYFKPVIDFMENELKANGEMIGFGECHPVGNRQGKASWAESYADGKFIWKN